ncbi:MAG: MFS transporter, partial [Desulfobacterales bacterium]|nr:MFS transporter [Desulfobacterales bacterium]
MNDRATQLTALTIASLSSFITPFMMSSINIAMPDIGKEFNADAVMLSWIAASYLLASAVTLVPFGKLADIYGRKKIFVLGMSLFTITSLLCALSV